MGDKDSLDDLTVEELEELLTAKRRAEKLERFRRVAADQEQRPGFSGQQGDVRTLRSAAGRGQRDSGYQSPGSPSGRTGREGGGVEAASFRPTRITPLTGFFGRVGRSVSDLGGRFWRKGFRRLRDRLLLLLELAALAGLIFVVFSSLSNLRVLNREVAEALESEQVATPAATVVAVLPGSSFPPGSEDRVPAPYRHLVQPGTTIPIPTPGPRQASRIAIPAIDVDVPVVEGDGWEELKMGAGHRIGSANPGERGNMVISGHNDVYGEIFRHLEDLKMGDEVMVYAGDTPYRYLVVGRMIVEPTEVSLLEPTPNATLTLITCHPYMIDSHRLVVIAELANQ